MIEFDSFRECCRTGAGGIVIDCFIQPKASRNAVVTIHDRALKIALTAPPLDGKANAALIKFLSKKLRLPKSSVIIERGAASRRKTLLLITDSELKQIFSKLT